MCNHSFRRPEVAEKVVSVVVDLGTKACHAVSHAAFVVDNTFSAFRLKPIKIVGIRE